MLWIGRPRSNQPSTTVNEPDHHWMEELVGGGVVQMIRT